MMMLIIESLITDIRLLEMLCLIFVLEFSDRYSFCFFRGDHACH